MIPLNDCRFSSFRLSRTVVFEPSILCIRIIYLFWFSFREHFRRPRPPSSPSPIPFLLRLSPLFPNVTFRLIKTPSDPLFFFLSLSFPKPCSPFHRPFLSVRFPELFSSLQFRLSRHARLLFSGIILIITRVKFITIICIRLIQLFFFLVLRLSV